MQRPRADPKHARRLFPMRCDLSESLPDNERLDFFQRLSEAAGAGSSGFEPRGAGSVRVLTFQKTTPLRNSTDFYL